MDKLDKKDNLITCINLFKKYMMLNYQVDVKQFSDYKEKFVDIIERMQNDPKMRSADLRTLNTKALNMLTNHYVTNYNLVKSLPKPNINNIDRDQNVYGPRENFTTIVPPPMNAKISDKSGTEEQFNRLMANRQPPSSASSASQVANQIEKPVTVQKLSESQFQNEFERFEKERQNDFIFNNIEVQKAQEQQHNDDILLPKSNATANTNMNAMKRDVFHQTQNRNFDYYPEFPQPKLYKSPTHYITINGYDRNWILQKNRFKFSIDMNAMAKTYKNINEIAFTHLIIPTEIVQNRPGSLEQPRRFFNHCFSLAQPYLILFVDEFNDVYDGLNQYNQVAFTNFIHDSSYQAPNGRGYTIMKPMQNEKKVFYPAPLSSLQKLSIKIAKPNGQLFNDSQDIYGVWKVEYESYNKEYLKIITNRYFDKNEFYIGDYVMIKQFMMPHFKNESEEDDNYVEYQQHRYTYNKINEYINQPEGHNILEIGKANQEGKYRYFYIQAPGEFDSLSGKFVIDKEMVDLIQSYNEMSFPESMVPSALGGLINTSLQPVLSLNLVLSEVDAAQKLQPKII